MQQIVVIHLCQIPQGLYLQEGTIPRQTILLYLQEADVCEETFLQAQVLKLLVPSENVVQSSGLPFVSAVSAPAAAAAGCRPFPPLEAAKLLEVVHEVVPMRLDHLGVKSGSTSG